MNYIEYKYLDKPNCRIIDGYTTFTNTIHPEVTIDPIPTTVILNEKETVAFSYRDYLNANISIIIKDISRYAVPDMKVECINNINIEIWENDIIFVLCTFTCNDKTEYHIGKTYDIGKGYTRDFSIELPLSGNEYLTDDEIKSKYSRHIMTFHNNCQKIFTDHGIKEMSRVENVCLKIVTDDTIMISCIYDGNSYTMIEKV